VHPPLKFHLEHYDGPLDLLLDLIRNQKIDIRDIPIATITSQYLAYIDLARERDIDIGAEFIFMAATLIHIKSRMLLPTDPALDAPGSETDEDPRTELVNRLLEHEKYKNAAEMLQQKRMIEENVWSNPRIAQYTAEDDDPGLDVNLFDLIKAFGQVIERAKSRPLYEVTSEETTVSEMILHLRSLLDHTRKDKPLFILQLIDRQRTRRAMICLFLAVLELVKRQAVQITQKDLFGEIALLKGVDFEDAFSKEEPVSVEEEYK
jgi:segregation and condensation protein A